MRIGVFWSELPPYAAACLRRLAEARDVELLVVRYAYRREKPFADRARALPIPFHTIGDADPLSAQWRVLRPLLKQSRPEVALISGWSIPVFNRAARWVRAQDAFVICMSDNQWRGDLRQVLGCSYARLVFKRRYSAMFVPGDRARRLAVAMGFHGSRLIMGSYSCDWHLFSSAQKRRKEQFGDKWPSAFLFAGSLVPRKGVRELAQAYSAYRRRVSAPWPLKIVGEGPLRSFLEGSDGVSCLGFQQPAELSQLMANAGTFVLPSRTEGWALAIHEATAAGLPVICTAQCGSNVELVRDHHNGYVCEAGDVASLVALMTRISAKNPKQLKDMGRCSYELSKQYTPELWVDRLLDGISQLRRP